jgi:hypothetical protein
LNVYFCLVIILNLTIKTVISYGVLKTLVETYHINSHLCRDICNNDNDKMDNSDKKYIIVNETPHYPITFASYSHLLEFADRDADIQHPMGGVYKAKIAHQDNMVRIVVLRNNSLPYDIGMGAFIFDKSKWLKYRNPFSPAYDETKTIINDRVTNVKQKLYKAVYRPAVIGIMKNVYRAKRIVNKIRSQTNQ